MLVGLCPNPICSASCRCRRRVCSKHFYNKKDSLGFFHAGRILGYDARVCHFNMDTGCVELLLLNGRKISIDCTGVEDALDVTMAQKSELDYLIYNDPLSYADLILNGNPEEYLKNVAGGHGSEDLSFRD